MIKELLKSSSLPLQGSPALFALHSPSLLIHLSKVSSCYQMISPCSGASLGLYVFLDTFSSPTTPVSFKRWHSKLSRTYLAGDPDSSGGDAKPNRTELKRLEISPPTKTRKSPHHASYAHSPVANSERKGARHREGQRENRTKTKQPLWTQLVKSSPY